MAQFTVRVELHRANQDDYDSLHSAMEEEGFSRQIKSSDGTRYYLPTAEYTCTSSKTRGEILDSAAAAATTTGKKWEIIVTESAGRSWQGLKEV
jgi:Endoribonuclease GhoS